MPVLQNARHERYCQEVAAGKSQTDAYAAVYGKQGRRDSAARLSAKANIRQRIDELTAKAAEQAVVDAAWIRRKLKDNAIQCMKAGDTFAPSAANKALELLGKDKGMFVDRRLVGVRNIDDMTEEELLEFLGGEPDPQELGAAARARAAGDA